MQMPTPSFCQLPKDISDIQQNPDMSAPLRLLVKTSVHPLKYLFCPNTAVSNKMENGKVMTRLRNELNLSKTEGNRRTKVEQRTGPLSWSIQVPGRWQLLRNPTAARKNVHLMQPRDERRLLTSGGSGAPC